ncbi:hypothetical protein HBI56_137880 [Parastagonospora nodorum]|uniref:BTB domain-containing protein n=1 Tax=Phaeosphaeria nodorum (strain SN15 / ATCC MYA-4574 / FGSC 10173) TaxID=321614 RepID=A0A7U2I967_PHANO|nr:hypothetical protein HBH56_129940 [Parastagonospora nodorum]QRD05559.1 hypothetical protein JI435_058450 [Parastagonospora nodorum SN15]KAH3931212.1 hypothetical protein HBH54_093560 [Parastagonospora nodorum]KAH3996455.1 hypothetical protein HBI10_158030 [Parastagonospora nodorum]KAH4018928.1 hypothetical protein HBI13_128050 [Parastagonospora nodorum]
MTRTKTKKLTMAMRKTNMEKRTVEPEIVTVRTFVAERTSDIAMDEALIQKPTYEIAVQETPILKPTKQVIVEGTHIAPEDEMLIEKPEERPFTSCDSTREQFQVSPYTKSPIELLIGPNHIVHYVPECLLPLGCSGSGSEKQWYLSDLNVETGHTLAHYLHTGVYETIDTQVDSSTFAKMKQALSVYFVSTDYGLPGLQRLTMCEMKEKAVEMNFIQFLRVLKDDIDRLDPGNWVLECLHQKAKAAFAEDHTVFKSEAFLENLEYPGVNRFMMKCVTELYDNMVSDLLRRENRMSASLDDCHETLRVLSEKKDVFEQGILTQQDFVTPFAGEPTCCGNETFQEDLVSNEDFCTISCPPSECPNDLVEFRRELTKSFADTTKHSKDADLAGSVSHDKTCSSTHLALDSPIRAGRVRMTRSAAKDGGKSVGSHLAAKFEPLRNTIPPQSKMTDKKESKKQKKLRKREELKDMIAFWEMTREQRCSKAEGVDVAPEPVEYSDHNRVESGLSWHSGNSKTPERVEPRISVLRARLAAILDDIESSQPSLDI